MKNLDWDQVLLISCIGTIFLIKFTCTARKSWHYTNCTAQAHCRSAIIGSIQQSCQSILIIVIVPYIEYWSWYWSRPRLSTSCLSLTLIQYNTASGYCHRTWNLKYLNNFGQWFSLWWSFSHTLSTLQIVTTGGMNCTIGHVHLGRWMLILILVKTSLCFAHASLNEKI